MMKKRRMLRRVRLEADDAGLRLSCGGRVRSNRAAGAGRSGHASAVFETEWKRGPFWQVDPAGSMINRCKEGISHVGLLRKLLDTDSCDFLFTFYAQAKVSSFLKGTLRSRNDRNLARRTGGAHGVGCPAGSEMCRSTIHGSLTDHYDPRSGYCAYRRRSAMSILWLRSALPVTKQGTPCSTQNYAPLKIKTPSCRSSTWHQFMLAACHSRHCSARQRQLYQNTLFNIAVIAMLAVILFHAVTLPVEFNASSRALSETDGSAQDC